ncbi:MAG: 5-formyltetrahydrofolate cyclo-ligase [Acidithiobacillus sp.]
MDYHHAIKARWAGRNSDKDVIREDAWNKLKLNKVNIGQIESRIPNFVGADIAAFNLANQDIWQNARVVKCNPDPSQIPVRLRALVENKRLYMPVPELVKKRPFVLLDPIRLARLNISYELAATSQGALEYGEPVEFDEIPEIDIVVIGCVAVTKKGARIGKGAGFADIELGIFRELGLVSKDTPVVTTVHSLQIIADDKLGMMPHDYPLDWIFSESDTLKTNTIYKKPLGIEWDNIQDDQYRDIPFLKSLREQIEVKRIK